MLGQPTIVPQVGQGRFYTRISRVHTSTAQGTSSSYNPSFPQARWRRSEGMPLYIVDLSDVKQKVLLFFWYIFLWDSKQFAYHRRYFRGANVSETKHYSGSGALVRPGLSLFHILTGNLRGLSQNHVKKR